MHMTYKQYLTFRVCLMFDTQGEKDGIQYHFVTAEEMSEGIRNGDFIESAFFAGNTYGTR